MTPEQKQKQSFLLRLPASIREQATSMAHEEETSLNHFITLAVAEKLSRLSGKSEKQEPRSSVTLSMVDQMNKTKRTG